MILSDSIHAGYRIQTIMKSRDKSNFRLKIGSKLKETLGKENDGGKVSHTSMTNRTLQGKPIEESW